MTCIANKFGLLALAILFTFGCGGPGRFENPISRATVHSDGKTLTLDVQGDSADVAAGTKIQEGASQVVVAAYFTRTGSDGIEIGNPTTIRIDIRLERPLGSRKLVTVDGDSIEVIFQNN